MSGVICSISAFFAGIKFAIRNKKIIYVEKIFAIKKDLTKTNIINTIFYKIKGL